MLEDGLGGGALLRLELLDLVPLREEDGVGELAVRKDEREYVGDLRDHL